MLALSEYRASLCPCGCGYRSEETRGAANEDKFEVPLPFRCWARDAMLQAQDGRTNTSRPEALLWQVKKVG